MGPLGGRGWHPISRSASPLLDVPIPLQIQTCPSPADTPQGSPTSIPSLTSKPLPVLPPPAQPPAASPPLIQLPSSPTDLCPSPTLHTPPPAPLVAGGHAPALAPESLRLRLARLPSPPVQGGAAAGRPRALLPCPSPPRQGEGCAPHSRGAGARPLLAHAYCFLGGGGWPLSDRKRLSPAPGRRGRV